MWHLGRTLMVWSRTQHKMWDRIATSPFCQLRRLQVILDHGFVLKEFALIESCCEDFLMLASKKTVRDMSARSWQATRGISYRSKSIRKFHSSRMLTFLETSHGPHAMDGLLSYIKSTFSELEGLNHCWFNMNGAIPSLDERGTFLILSGVFLHTTPLCCRKQTVLFERVKLLQKMYPNLQVFGFQHCNSISSARTQARVALTIAEEYVHFPVLLSDKNFFELQSGVCYLFFGGCEDRLPKYGPDVDIEAISAEIANHSMLLSSESDHVKEEPNNRVNDLDVSKGFQTCYSLKNILLSCPGCVSADENGDRFFISDTNHHRIIVCNSHGKIVDCIGSFPGYMDGAFESAQMLRPAGTFYHADENCLYFADCENHSIRRADLTSRVVNTLYPFCGNNGHGMWSWILAKLGVTGETEQGPVEFTFDSLASPWHVMKIGENDLLVLTRSIETSWILSMKTGQIKSIVRGFSNIMESYKMIIMHKASVIKELCRNHAFPMAYSDSSVEIFQFLTFLSATAELRGNYLYCETAAQRVLKCNPASGKVTNINFSDMEVLGIPYWIVNPIEAVSPRCRDAHTIYGVDHLQNFNILPGRCNILVNVVLPDGLDLASPIKDECIWREARGSAVEITNMEDAEYSEKVGVAQQWFDELDNLAFCKVYPDSSFQSQEAHSDSLPEVEKKMQFDCSVNTSPGTSEIVIITPLYVKLQTAYDERELESKLLNLYKTPAAFGGVELLLESVKDPRALIFMKPLHLRIRLDSADHPIDPVTKEIISTTTNLEVNVSL